MPEILHARKASSAFGWSYGCDNRAIVNYISLSFAKGRVDRDNEFSSSIMLVIEKALFGEGESWEASRDASTFILEICMNRETKYINIIIRNLHWTCLQRILRSRFGS